MKLKKINKDKRGEIWLIEGLLSEKKEFTIMKTKKGFARGGCIHKKYDEGFFVVSGDISFTMGSTRTTMSCGDFQMIPAGYPHMYESFVNSIVIEYGVPASDKKKKDKSMRKLVEEINKNAI